MSSPAPYSIPGTHKGPAGRGEAADSPARAPKARWSVRGAQPSSAHDLSLRPSLTHLPRQPGQTAQGAARYLGGRRVNHSSAGAGRQRAGRRRRHDARPGRAVPSPRDDERLALAPPLALMDRRGSQWEAPRRWPGLRGALPGPLWGRAPGRPRAPSGSALPQLRPPLPGAATAGAHPRGRVRAGRTTRVYFSTADCRPQFSWAFLFFCICMCRSKPWLFWLQQGCF